MNDSIVAAKSRAPMMRAYVIAPGKVEFRQGGERHEIINMHTVPSDMRDRLAVEGLIRHYLLGVETHKILDGSGLPQRTPPEAKVTEASAMKASMKMQAALEREAKTREKLAAEVAAAKAKYEEAMAKLATISA